MNSLSIQDKIKIGQENKVEHFHATHFHPRTQATIFSNKVTGNPLYLNTIHRFYT